jgi:altronate hydrolase
LPAAPIAPGEWVHTQNVEMHDFARDYRFAEGAKNDEVPAARTARDVRGLCAAWGKTGTRNYIGILTSVNCSASAARFIAREVERSGVLADHPEIDGVVAFVHGTGCGLAGLRRRLRRCCAGPSGVTRRTPTSAAR